VAGPWFAPDAKRPGRLIASPRKPDGRQVVVYISKDGRVRGDGGPKPEKKKETERKEGLGAILPRADHWSTWVDARWRPAPVASGRSGPFGIGVLQ